jgi:carboxyl-terminal processing protease
MKRQYLLVLMGFVMLTAACKKHSSDPGPTTPPPSKLDLMRDSVFLYAQEDYYWNDGLPSATVFNARGFTGPDDPTTLQNEVNAISQYKINPATGKPFEYVAASPGHAKYSFIDGGQLSAVLGGTQGDFGCGILYNTTTDLRIKYVYPNSPASAAGIKRGYQIIKMNGSTNLTYDGSGPNVTFVSNAFFSSPSITMTLQRANGTTFNVSLNTASYTTNPVIKDTIVNTTNNKKVGYMVFNQFTTLANSKTFIDDAFTYFTTNNITDLVVDLRYNGGGAVETARYLDNYIVPPAKTGTTMYTAYFNAKLQADQDPLLRKIYAINNGDFLPANNTVAFAKKGTLDLSHVFFIVTGSTASASELVINNLFPEMNVQLIGTTSYGKPVGFFAIPINVYQLYLPEFETKNSAGIGGYYTGMTPGGAGYPGFYDFDDLTKDFGDPTEVLFAHALSYVTKGTFAAQTPRIQSIGSGSNSLSADEITQMTRTFDNNQFKGMVNDKKLIRK